jgi:hypothetical protein
MDFPDRPGRLPNVDFGFDARDSVVNLDDFADQSIEFDFEVVEARFNAIESIVNAVEARLHAVESGVKRIVLNGVREDSDQNGKCRDSDRQVKLHVTHRRSYCTARTGAGRRARR